MTPNVLRHSFTSLGADLGYSDITIGAIVGHKGRTITSRYIHSADSVLLSAADAIADRTAALMSGNKGESRSSLSGANPHELCGRTPETWLLFPRLELPNWLPGPVAEEAKSIFDGILQKERQREDEAEPSKTCHSCLETSLRKIELFPSNIRQTNERRVAELYR